MSTAGPVRATLIVIALSFSLVAIACGDVPPPVYDSSTGGAGGAAGKATGGTDDTGGRITLTGGHGATSTGGSATGGSIGGTATGGAKATGGSSTGGAGTGGSSAGVDGICIGFIPYGSSIDAPGKDNTVATCWKTNQLGLTEVRFTADGKTCGTCSFAGSPVTGCEAIVKDVRARGTATPANITCVDACASCPVVRCFSTGGDYGTEYPCN